MTNMNKHLPGVSVVLGVLLAVGAAMIGAESPAAQGLGALAAPPPKPVFERAPDEPSFDVVSVKRADPADPNNPLSMIPMVMPPVGGQFRANNITLKLLVRTAYQVEDFQLAGGPAWQNTDRFNITATSPSGFTGGMPEVLPMVRSVLADRFKLKTHKETREVPIYELRLARSDGRLGPKIKASTSECSNAQAEQQKMAEAVSRGDTSALAGLLQGNVKCAMMPMLPGIGGRGAAPGGNPLAGFGLKADGQAMSVLVQMLQQVMGRTVVDKTGLTGLYDFEMVFNPEVLLRAVSQFGINIPPQAAAALGNIDSPSLTTALQQDLGLKLESERGPGDVLVIDSVEPPQAD
jgi:uncharacterized protein (TIGR03435 family)